MKTLRTTIAVAFAAIALLSLGVMSVAAQGPTATSQVAYLDNQPHTIAANTSQLYRFDYSINADDTRPTTTIRLMNGTNSGVGFEVWTADGLTNLANSAADGNANTLAIQPVGRGTAATINCDTGALDGSGSCQANDLTWTGTFGTSGSYFVKIINNNPAQSSYQLVVSGDGVSLKPQTQTASAPAAPVPAAAPALVTAATDPNKAVAIDGQPHSLAAGVATWYKFDYAINADDTRPTATIRLVNGNVSGVSFEIWTSDELANLANSAADGNTNTLINQPVGRGTAATINCDTGALDGSGSCKANDLTWSGTFGTSATYFVKVINNSTTQANYQLVMSVQ